MIRPLCIALLMAVPLMLPAGTTIRVPQDFPTIQQAIDAAPRNAVIEVEPGTYSESLAVFDRSVEIRALSKKEVLVGPGNSAPGITVGPGGSAAITGLYVSGAPAALVFDGGSLAATDGRFSDGSPVLTAGGIVEVRGADSDFSANTVDFVVGLRSAAVYTSAARDISLFDCTIPAVGTGLSGNADFSALYIDGANSLSIQDGRFLGTRRGAGGRILQAGSVSISGSDFYGGNGAYVAPEFIRENGGAGLVCDNAATLNLSRSRFFGGQGAFVLSISDNAGNGGVGLRVTGTATVEGSRCEILGGSGGQTLNLIGGSGGNGFELVNGAAFFGCSSFRGGQGGAGGFFQGPAGAATALVNASLLRGPCGDTLVVP